jgi:hypothetical protein
MHKRLLHHYEKRLRPISGWYLLIATVFFLSIAAFALRQNNLRMIELRNQVFQADEAGDNIEAALRDLRAHVHSHMNADLTSSDTSIHPPIQLQHTYKRLVDEEQARVRVANQSVYQQAEQICEERFPAGRLANGRVQCVEQYVLENGVQAREIPKALYQFDFVSPRWSPDLAGWSLLFGSILGSLLLVRSIVALWLRYKLNQ